MVKQITMGKDAFGRSVTLGDLISVIRKNSTGASPSLLMGTVIGISPTGMFKIEDMQGAPVVQGYAKKPLWFPGKSTTLIAHHGNVEKYLQDIYDWELENATDEV